MCTSSIYEPVCGADDLTYFSPCRAGCMKRPDENDPSVSHYVFYMPFLFCLLKKHAVKKCNVITEKFKVYFAIKFQSSFDIYFFW